VHGVPVLAWATIPALASEQAGAGQVARPRARGAEGDRLQAVAVRDAGSGSTTGSQLDASS